MKTRETVTITKEVGNTKSVELRNDGRSRIDVFVNGKKVSNNERKAALNKLEGDIKTTTITKTYDLEWNLLNEDVKVNESEYMKLVNKAIQGYINR